MDKKILTEKLEQMRVDSCVAGMSVAVTDREKIIYSEGFGVESVERPEVPHGADSMFRIASMTKIVTSIMVMRLVEEGHLSLDGLVRDYVPDLKLSRPEALEQLTLKHLLTHTGGFPKDGVIPEGSRNEETIEADVERIVPTLEIATLPEEGVPLYANVGFVIAGYMASKVTGKPLAQLLDEYVIQPLGMERTTLDFFRAATWTFSQPHFQLEDGGFEVEHRQRINTYYHACGGLYSNTTDMCRLARFLLNRGVNDSGERLLKEETIENMFTKHTLKDINPGDYYGLGIHIHKYEDRFFYGHSGNIHPYNTSVFVDYETGLGVVTLMNSDASDMRFAVPETIINIMEKQ